MVPKMKLMLKENQARVNSQKSCPRNLNALFMEIRNESDEILQYNGDPDDLLLHHTDETQSLVVTFPSVLADIGDAVAFSIDKTSSLLGNYFFEILTINAVFDKLVSFFKYN
jgi:hypothetical protein